MTARKKYYVVWKGIRPGVYDNWADCRAQVFQVDGAKFKSFESMQAACEALEQGYEAYYRSASASKHSALFPPAGDNECLPAPIMKSLCVDAACNSVTGEMEYRGVYTETREVWFHKGPFINASNNIGEFLALVHGLALLQQKKLTIPIYSDSMTAITWVRRKKHNSIILPTHENAVLFDMLRRAESWLKLNIFKNPVYKWNTPLWGEIPADFGRK